MVDRRHWLVVVVAAMTLVAACSGGSKPTISADDAASGISKTFSLPSGEQDCLTTEFSTHPQAAAALDPAAGPTEHQLDELGAVLSSCVAVESIAASVVASVAKGIGTVSSSQQDCLRSAVIGLSDDDRTVLMTGLAVTNAQGTTSLGLSLARVTSGLLDGCGISVAGSTDTSTGVDPGAVTVTR